MYLKSSSTYFGDKNSNPDSEGTYGIISSVVGYRVMVDWYTDSDYSNVYNEADLEYYHVVQKHLTLPELMQKYGLTIVNKNIKQGRTNLIDGHRFNHFTLGDGIGYNKCVQDYIVALLAYEKYIVKGEKYVPIT